MWSLGKVAPWAQGPKRVRISLTPSNVEIQPCSMVGGKANCGLTHVFWEGHPAPPLMVQREKQRKPSSLLEKPPFTIEHSADVGFSILQSPLWLAFTIEPQPRVLFISSAGCLGTRGCIFSFISRGSAAGKFGDTFGFLHHAWQVLLLLWAHEFEELEPSQKCLVGMSPRLE